MRRTSEDWKEKDFPLYNGRSSENRTDRYRGHFQDEIFPLWRKHHESSFLQQQIQERGCPDNDYKKVLLAIPAVFVISDTVIWSVVFFFIV